MPLKARKARVQKRNEHIYQLYKKCKNKNPKWRWDAVIVEVAGVVFLAPSTVGRIVESLTPNTSLGEKLPCADTIIKYTRAVA